ncbi:hypothetical protein Plhal304r1_c025g0084931 [Plasmopara halstedii]
MLITCNKRKERIIKANINGSTPSSSAKNNVVLVIVRFQQKILLKMSWNGSAITPALK